MKLTKKALKQAKDIIEEHVESIVETVHAAQHAILDLEEYIDEGILDDEDEEYLILVINGTGKFLEAKNGGE